MTCEAIRPLLHAHLDQELDPDRDLEVEHHLAGCPACTQALQDLRALQGALRTLLPPTDPPPQLQTRIQVALRKEYTPPASFQPWWRKLSLSLAVALVVVVAGGLLCRNEIRSWFDHTPEEVAASHERFQMNEQLGIASSDPERVQAWLAERLSFKPSVPNLAKQGFRLAGGRVDIVSQRPVAVLVYEHDGHAISLLAWRAEEGWSPEPVQARQVRGLHLAHWVETSLNLWAVSDLDEPTLRDFAERVQTQLPSVCH